MKIVYTEHAEDKLKRADIKKFKINKRLINKTLRAKEFISKTKYGEFAILTSLNGHTLRIIYDKIDGSVKVITFHIAVKGRYETKILQKG